MGLLRFIKKTFALDERSLGLYRILIGLIIMADVLYRLPDLRAFYTDGGIVPRSIFTGEMTMPWSFSLHLANGSFGFIVVMFLIHLLIGIMLVVGYKTRWAMILAYIFTVSIHNRNWLINNGGDDILRAILLLSIFLPLNRRFSVDSAMREKPENTHTDGEHFSTWSLAFFLQVFVIYFVSYILKDHPIWRKDYTAMFFASRLEIFSTPIGVWMRGFPGLQKFFTILTIYAEWIGPLILVFAFVLGRFWWIARTFAVFIFWSFHLGIILTMWIGVFPYTCLAMWSLFLPGVLWDKLGQKWRRDSLDKCSIYFDADCGFCKKGVLIIREFFLLPEVIIAPAQSVSKVFSEMQREHSWVVVNEKGEHFFHFAAAVELMRHSPVLRYFVPIARFKPFFAIGNMVYKWVSHHRPLMGKVTQFLEYSSPKKSHPFFSWLFQLSGAFIFATILMWNLTTIKKLHVKSPFFQSVGRWLHLYQEWNMFAPFPKIDNVWIEVPAVLEDGSEIELITGSSDIYGMKDEAFYRNVPNEHWRKFYLNLSDRSDYARYFAGYLCRSWNDRKIRSRPDQTLRKLEVIAYSQPNLENGDRGGISRSMSWRHWCFDEDYKKDNAKPSQKAD